MPTKVGRRPRQEYGAPSAPNRHNTKSSTPTTHDAIVAHVVAAPIIAAGIIAACAALWLVTP